MSIKLPVYELQPAEINRDQLVTLAADLFDLRGEVTQAEDRLIVADKSASVELFTASGAIHAADHSQLFNPSLTPSLPTAEQAYEQAKQLIDRHNLHPGLGDGFQLTVLDAGGTYVAHRPRRGKQRTERALDIQARFAVSVRNPGVEGEADLLPLVGGGGKLAFTFGHEGRLIAFQSGWRATSEPKFVDALGRDEAYEQYQKAAGGDLVDATGYLAYFAAPGDVEQHFLTPVWVFNGSSVVEHADGQDRSLVPSRSVIIAATDLGPVFPPSKPQPDRAAQAPAPKAAPGPRAGNPNEVGTSWIKKIGTLPQMNGSPQNAQGFVDGMAADGWRVNFNWGDANAWESDWDSDDDSWVDAADFVFYTGHANMNGWVLADPGTTNPVLLTPSVVGSFPQTPGDKYGQNDLEWFAIGACGPLQDDVISPGGGDVLSRWDGAFDGLHTLLGYGAITFDTTDEGRKLARYTRDGMTVINAWFRSAKEVQPGTNGAAAPNGPTVWVGAMWVTKPGADPSNDHVWGHGSVSNDPSAPTQLVCMWTTC